MKKWFKKIIFKRLFRIEIGAFYVNGIKISDYNIDLDFSNSNEFTFVWRGAIKKKTLLSRIYDVVYKW